MNDETRNPLEESAAELGAPLGPEIGLETDLGDELDRIDTLLGVGAGSAASAADGNYCATCGGLQPGPGLPDTCEACGNPFVLHPDPAAL